jgi:hypothetical protein
MNAKTVGALIAVAVIFGLGGYFISKGATGGQGASVYQGVNAKAIAVTPTSSTTAGIIASGGGSIPNISAGDCQSQCQGVRNSFPNATCSYEIGSTADNGVCNISIPITGPHSSSNNINTRVGQPLNNNTQ